MTEPKKPGGRWDGWELLDAPTQAELEEPIIIPGIEEATPDDVTDALMQPPKKRR